MHSTLPSMAGLAQLWGFASKSAAARRVKELIDRDILQWSPDRRLRPGAAFEAKNPGLQGNGEKVSLSSPARKASPTDLLDQAVDSWGDKYERELSDAYAITIRLRRLARAIELELSRSAAKEGLTAGEVLVLDALYRSAAPHQVTLTELKHLFLISLAGVGKRVDRLDELGLIDRIPNPEDGRGLLVGLNKKGIALLKKMVARDRRSPHIIWPLSLPAEDLRALKRSINLAQKEIDRGRQSNRG